MAEWEVVTGDCLEVLRGLPDNSFHSMVTDPPAGIGFMGRDWDSDKGGRVSWIGWMTEVMKECLRVLKPGGHALVWAIPRTSHWTATALEDAGFEVRDVITHHFGCLSADTEILLDGQWEPYHKIAEGRHALCYNVDEGTYSWQPIQETFIYDYADTAYRLRGDYTDQIVSRSHRCLVKRDGTLVFKEAQSLERNETVPVLENLPDLLYALHVSRRGRSSQTCDLFGPLQGEMGSVAKSHSTRSGETTRQPQTSVSSCESLSGLRTRLRVLRTLASVAKDHLLHEMQIESSKYRARRTTKRSNRIAGDGDVRTMRDTEGIATERTSVSKASLLQSQLSFEAVSVREGHDGSWLEGAFGMVGAKSHVLSSEDDWSEQSRLEGWSDVLPQARQLSSDQVCSVSRRVPSDGSEGWLRDGTPADRGTTPWEMSSKVRGGASHQSRSNRQPANQSDAVQEQSGSQTVRGDRFTRTDLVTVEPVPYVGKVWCVRVPTGVFVARRNGQVFITGNSGFPKSQDVGKFIDKMAGAERKPTEAKRRMSRLWSDYRDNDRQTSTEHEAITAPATDEAKQWDGWGTALKPATEHWILVRKPLSESSIAKNVLKWGTGALNIDACRVHRTADDVPGWHQSGAKGSDGYLESDTFKIRDMSPEEIQERCGDKGRWPTNLLLSHSLDCNNSMCVEDCPVAELDRQSGIRRNGGRNDNKKQRPESVVWHGTGKPTDYAGDSGGASRFFPTFRYQAKPSRSEREAGLDDQPERTLNRVNPGGIEHDPRWAPVQVRNNHPTVKSIELMKWLLVLSTPPDGYVLDPFLGSGSTGCAAVQLGYGFFGCDKDPDYVAIARARIRYWQVKTEVGS